MKYAVHVRVINIIAENLIMRNIYSTRRKIDLSTCVKIFSFTKHIMYQFYACNNTYKHCCKDRQYIYIKVIYV